MKLKIKKDNEKIFVSFAKEFIEISENSQNWNTDGINKFLIKIATSLSADENIEIEKDDNKEDEVYNYIVELFTKFAEQFRKQSGNV